MARRGAGKFDQRVAIYQPQQNTASDGQSTITWPATPLATVWAQVVQTGGTQKFEHAQQAGQTQYMVTVRATPITRQIDAQSRLIWKGRTINVISAIEETPYVVITGAKK